MTMQGQTEHGYKSKTFFNDDPLQAYCVSHSTDLMPCQLELIQESLKHAEKEMLGSSDVMQLCSNLLRMIDARKVIDIGTFTGNSALAWALAIPDDGKVFTMDKSDEDYVKYGKKYIEKAGVAHKIDFRIKSALETLNELIQQGLESSFDFAFIDADKYNYSNYYELCMRLIKPGGIIAVDNALWEGSVVHKTKSASTQAIDDMNNRAKCDPRVDTTLLPIGDGLMLIFKKRP